MTESQPTTREAPQVPGHPARNRIIKRFGGRHFVYKVKYDRWSLLPRPYILISTFRGPVWAFYGIGQIWITHKRLKEIDGWIARVSRFSQSKLGQLLDSLDVPVRKFIQTCNEHGIQGTIVIEQRLIEFHWTVGRHVEKPLRDDQRDELVEATFQSLVEAFADHQQSASTAEHGRSSS